MDQTLLAVIAFGLLLAIAVFGLFSSNTSAARRNGSASHGSVIRRDDGTRVSDVRR